MISGSGAISRRGGEPLHSLQEQLGQRRRPSGKNKKKVDSRARIGAGAPRAVMATLRRNAGALQPSIKEAR